MTNIPPIKPGRQTSEFWVALVTQVVQAILAVIALLTGETPVAAAAVGGMGISMGLTSSSYSKARGVVKAAPTAGKIAMILLLLPMLASCTPLHLDARANRSFFEAVAPEYRAYVESDALLSDTQKYRRYRTLDRYREKLEAADRSLRTRFSVEEQR